MLSIDTSTIAGAQKVGHSNIPTCAAFLGNFGGWLCGLSDFVAGIAGYIQATATPPLTELRIWSRGFKLREGDRDASRNLRIVAQERKVCSQGSTIRVFGHS